MFVTRRAIFVILQSLLAATLLASCGFQLRGADGRTNLPFATIHVGFPESSSLGAELRRQIRATGGTQIVDDPKTAQASIEALGESREESVLSLNSQGRIRELALYYRLTFRVKNTAGKELLPSTDIVLKRDMSFNEAQVLAKESEKAMLYRDMQTDVVQQILRRLAAIKSA
ncbi:MAG: hypothetical protein HYS18_13545 [Burkholderiales bacterium]|nr:hypothetical protein [Burkholderiales bacterium]